MDEQSEARILFFDASKLVFPGTLFHHNEGKADVRSHPSPLTLIFVYPFDVRMPISSSKVLQEYGLSFDPGILSAFMPQRGLP